MQSPKVAFAVCSLSLFTVLPATADDLTIGIGMYPLSTTTLFVSSSDVRYRARYRDFESQDWLFNVASDRLLVINHKNKSYYETTAQDRNEVRRLSREVETQLPALPDGKIAVERKPCEASLIKYLRAPPPTLAPDSADAIPQIERCEQHSISIDDDRGWSDLPGRHPIARWSVTEDLQAPAFFKFQDAVLEEDNDPWYSRTPSWIWGQAYDGIKSKGLFPLQAYASPLLPSTPTYGARDLLFHPISWSALFIRKGPINPAVFTIVKEGDSVLSASLPASYKKIDSPVVQRMEYLKSKMESNKQLKP